MLEQNSIFNAKLFRAERGRIQLFNIGIPVIIALAAAVQRSHLEHLLGLIHFANRRFADAQAFRDFSLGWGARQLLLKRVVSLHHSMAQLLEPSGVANGLSAIAQVVLNFARHQISGVRVEAYSRLWIEFGECVEQPYKSNLNQVLERLET